MAAIVLGLKKAEKRRRKRDQAQKKMKDA